MGKESEDKAERILSIYTRLKMGKVVFKEKESAEFGVATRTIQRDIADIQCFLQNQTMESGEVQEIIFDKTIGGYILQTKSRMQFEGKEILAIAKVLLESRSLMKTELFPMIRKLIGICNDGLVVSAAVNYVATKIMATINSWIDKIDTPEKRARRIETYRMIAKQAEEESKVLIKFLSEAQNQYEKDTSLVLDQLELAEKTRDMNIYGNAIQKLCESYDVAPQFFNTDSVKNFIMTPGSSLVLGDKIECHVGQ